MDTTILLILAVFLTAGLVKGVTGMGLPTLAMALLSLHMPPLQAAGLLVVPSLLTNLWQLLAGAPVYTLWLRFAPMMAGICAGTLVGSAFALPSESGSIVLGLALLAYAAIGLAGVRWQAAPDAEDWLSPLMGILTGLLTAATGVFVLPAVPYLQALDLERDELVQAMGLSFMVSTMALAVALAARGAWGVEVAGLSFAAQIPALAGMLLGQRLRKRMQPELFRRCFLAVLLLVGAHLVISSI